MQYVWSPDGRLVLRDRRDLNSTAPGGIGYAGSPLNERVYAQQDAAGHVTSVAGVAGSVLERYAYTPEGRRLYGSAGGHGPGRFDFRYGYRGGRLDGEGLWDLGGGAEWDYLTGGVLGKDPPAYAAGRQAEPEKGRSMLCLDPLVLKSSCWIRFRKPRKNAVPHQRTQPGKRGSRQSRHAATPHPESMET